MKRVVIGATLIAIAVAAAGAKLGADESFTVAMYKGRPHLLRFGPKARLGRCTVAETSDPSSDVLSNLIDRDSDGRSDLRLTAFIDASPPICEVRLGVFWFQTAVGQCRGASESCADTPTN